MTIRIVCPPCRGEGHIPHQVFPAGGSPDDHDDICDCCRNRAAEDGVCYVFDSHWERWRATIRLHPCRRLRVVR